MAAFEDAKARGPWLHTGWNDQDWAWRACRSVRSMPEARLQYSRQLGHYIGRFEVGVIACSCSAGTHTHCRFIYTMAIAMDANFRLKRRAVSNNVRDPALGSGWGYFVEDTAYNEHILRHANQDDVRSGSARV